jgi:ankyrin repeat protein
MYFTTIKSKDMLIIEGITMKKRLIGYLLCTIALSITADVDWSTFKDKVAEKAAGGPDKVCKPLHNAAIKGDLATVQSLVTQGANVNEIGCFWKMTPIQAALFEWKSAAPPGDTLKATVVLIFTKNADYFTNMPKIEFLGDKNAISAVVEYLLNHGAVASIEHTTDAFNWTALHIAAIYGHDKATTILCQKGANKEALTVDGNTPLIIACTEGRTEVVRALLDQGANMQGRKRDINITDPKEDAQPMAIHFAAFLGYKDIAEVFMQHKLSGNVADTTGKTALMYAAGASRAETVAVLLKYNTDPNVQDSTGKTALHYAAEQLSKETIEALLAKGAHKDIKDLGDKTEDLLIPSGSDTITCYVPNGKYAKPQSPVGRAVKALLAKNPKITEDEILNNPIIQLLKYK